MSNLTDLRKHIMTFIDIGHLLTTLSVEWRKSRNEIVELLKDHPLTLPVMAVPLSDKVLSEANKSSELSEKLHKLHEIGIQFSDKLNQAKQCRLAVAQIAKESFLGNPDQGKVSFILKCPFANYKAYYITIQKSSDNSDYTVLIDNTYCLAGNV